MGEAKPRINPAAIDLLTRVFNSHKKGLPEWMKNAREAYFRKDAEENERFIAINYQSDAAPEILECIDFVGSPATTSNPDSLSGLIQTLQDTAFVKAIEREDKGTAGKRT